MPKIAQNAKMTKMTNMVKNDQTWSKMAKMITKR